MAEKRMIPDEIAKGRMTLEQAWARLAELDAADKLRRERREPGAAEYEWCALYELLGVV